MTEHITSVAFAVGKKCHMHYISIVQYQAKIQKSTNVYQRYI